MNIVVLGGAGYIGTVLVQELVKLGHCIKVVDLFLFEDHIQSDDNILKMDQDIFNLKVEDLIGYDIVINLSGLSNDPQAELFPRRCFLNNVSLPAYIGYIAKQAKVPKFIHASSCSVYGFANDRMFTEKDPTNCSFPYGVSKIQSEEALKPLANEDFQILITRSATVSGYSPRMRLDLIVNTMFVNALYKNKIDIQNPILWRPIISIQDIVKGYISLVESDLLSSYANFNFVGDNFTILEIGNEVFNFFKAKGIKIEALVHNWQDFRSYRASGQKAKDILWFEAKDSIQDILQDLWNNKEKFSDYESYKYKNVEVFKNIFVNDVIHQNLNY